MKKLTLGILAAFMLLSVLPTTSKAESETIEKTTIAAKTVESPDATAQQARLEEIKGLDLSTLDRSEKKELRKEVRTIKNDQDGRGHRNHGNRGGGDYDGRHGGGTVYFMGGGGLLIILLIILLI